MRPFVKENQATPSSLSPHVVPEGERVTEPCSVSRSIGDAIPHMGPPVCACAAPAIPPRMIVLRTRPKVLPVGNAGSFLPTVCHITVLLNPGWGPPRGMSEVFAPKTDETGEPVTERAKRSAVEFGRQGGVRRRGRISAFVQVILLTRRKLPSGALHKDFLPWHA